VHHPSASQLVTHSSQSLIMLMHCLVHHLSIGVAEKNPYYFDSAAQAMGLHTSSSKTEVQNTGYGLPAFPVQILFRCFTYLSSDIESSGLSSHDVHRHIGLASSIMDIGQTPTPSSISSLN